MKNKIIILNILLLCVIFSSCKKLVEVDGPATSVSSKDIYNNDQTAAGSLTYLYTNLSKANLSAPGEFVSLSSIAGLSADELSYFTAAGNATLSAYYTNSLTNLNSGGQDFWTTNYINIFAVNAALEGLSNSGKLSSSVKQQLIGEAKFMRAFYYFYLVNLYGDIPLVLSTDYTINSLIAKTTKSKVYEQIVSDLKDANTLLSSQYLKGDGATPYSMGSEERVRPTKWLAKALLARTYLYLKDWANAEVYASAVLENQADYKLVSIDEVFLKNNKEAIWQLQPIYNGLNTADANLFVLLATGPSRTNPVFLNSDLVNVFENGDLRKSRWIGNVNVNNSLYYYPFKYKVIFSNTTGVPVLEYTTVFRIAELYLIRAEARTQLGNISGAISDVDEIRKRAGLSLIKDINPGITQADLLTAVAKENQLEYFAEWGHRWLDLKRLGKIDEVMTTATPRKAIGLEWKTYQQYYPISLNELKANPNLVQVLGY